MVQFSELRIADGAGNRISGAIASSSCTSDNDRGMKIASVMTPMDVTLGRLNKSDMNWNRTPE